MDLVGAAVRALYIYDVLFARVVELVDTRDLKSRPLGCRFDSGHGYYNL